jgi:phage N-6-adenine-methyltransferase
MKITAQKGAIVNMEDRLALASLKATMKKNQSLFTSSTDMWETPQWLFDEINRVFEFTLDACAVPQNAKCSNYFAPEDNALTKEWTGSVWCNPPYGRSILKWVKKAHESSLKGATVVCLLPARVDTRWFHDICLPYGQIYFIKGRLKFGGSKNNAPFPSMIVVFYKK